MVLSLPLAIHRESKPSQVIFEDNRVSIDTPLFILNHFFNYFEQNAIVVTLYSLSITSLCAVPSLIIIFKVGLLPPQRHCRYRRLERMRITSMAMPSLPGCETASTRSFSTSVGVFQGRPLVCIRDFVRSIAWTTTPLFSVVDDFHDWFDWLKYCVGALRR